MRDVVIVDARYTAVSSFGGNLRPLKVDALTRTVVTAALERTSLESGQVDEIFLGHCRRFSDCSNTTRYTTLLAGILGTVPVSTAMCACASDMLAVNCGFDAIRTGQDQVVLVGGTENMSNAIFYLPDACQGVSVGTTQPKDSFTEAQFCSQPQDIYGRFNVGIAAENIAARMGITREEQGRFALASQKRTRAAIAADRFKDEIVPLAVPQDRKKPDKIFDTDEFPRETSLKLLSRLKPAFLPPDDTVATGNSSGRNGDAFMLVLINAQLAKEQGLKLLTRILGVASAGVNPCYMRLGPVPATQRTLEMADLRLDGIQLIELNGAFAAQSIGCIQELGLQGRVGIINVNGGTITLGHPIGSFDSRILVTPVHEMNKRGLHYDLVTLCIAGGMGMATIVETVQ